MPNQHLLAPLLSLISPGISTSRLLTDWQVQPLSLVSFAVVTALAAGYLAAVRRLAQRGRAWPLRRTAAFMGGLVALVIATGSGLASYDDSVFVLHVVQHLILMNGAPILLLLGAPVTLAIQAAKRPSQRRLVKVMGSPYVKLVTCPPVAAALAYLTMIVYFLTPVYEISLRHPLLHDYFHLHFIVAGCLYWWTVIGEDQSHWRLSYPARLAFLATGIPVNAILGIVLTSARASIDPAAHSLSDTHAGGAILWGVGELILVLGLAIMFVQWSNQDRREAARADRRLERELSERGTGLAGGTTGLARSDNRPADPGAPSGPYGLGKQAG